MCEDLRKKWGKKKTKKKIFPEYLPWLSGKRLFPSAKPTALEEANIFLESRTITFGKERLPRELFLAHREDFFFILS